MADNNDDTYAQHTGPSQQPLLPGAQPTSVTPPVTSQAWWNWVQGWTAPSAEPDAAQVVSVHIHGGRNALPAVRYPLHESQQQPKQQWRRIFTGENDPCQKLGRTAEAEWKDAQQTIQDELQGADRSLPDRTRIAEALGELKDAMAWGALKDVGKTIGKVLVKGALKLVPGGGVLGWVAKKVIGRFAGKVIDSLFADSAEVDARPYLSQVKEFIAADMHQRLMDSLKVKGKEADDEEALEEVGSFLKWDNHSRVVNSTRTFRGFVVRSSFAYSNGKHKCCYTAFLAFRSPSQAEALMKEVASVAKTVELGELELADSTSLVEAWAAYATAVQAKAALRGWDTEERKKAVEEAREAADKHLEAIAEHLVRQARPEEQRKADLTVDDERRIASLKANWVKNSRNLGTLYERAHPVAVVRWCFDPNAPDKRVAKVIGVFYGGRFPKDLLTTPLG